MYSVDLTSIEKGNTVYGLIKVISDHEILFYRQRDTRPTEIQQYYRDGSRATLTLIKRE